MKLFSFFVLAIVGNAALDLKSLLGGGVLGGENNNPVEDVTEALKTLFSASVTPSAGTAKNVADLLCCEYKWDTATSTTLSTVNTNCKTAMDKFKKSVEDTLDSIKQKELIQLFHQLMKMQGQGPMEMYPSQQSYAPQVFQPQQQYYPADQQMYQPQPYFQQPYMPQETFSPGVQETLPLSDAVLMQ